jgi:SanA protein
MIPGRFWLYLSGFSLLVLAALAMMIPRWLLHQRFKDHIYTPDNAPALPTAVVLGAGLRKDGRPSTVLADRVRTAALLYEQGKVDQIIMSGSIHGSGYNEPIAMRDLAAELGVPSESILLDTGGDRTYQSCLRTYQYFGIEQAVIISQQFHLPRALALCDSIGIAAVGVAADLRPYRAQLIWEIREIPATLRALWDTRQCAPRNKPLSQHPTPFEEA